jgi:hypothetical protein
LYGNLSTAAFIAAGAALATSGVLYLGSRRRARPAELVPAIGPGVVGIAVSGAL